MVLLLEIHQQVDREGLVAVAVLAVLRAGVGHPVVVLARAVAVALAGTTVAVEAVTGNTLNGLAALLIIYSVELMLLVLVVQSALSGPAVPGLSLQQERQTNNIRNRL
jgi:hypothetical protein